MHSNFFASDRPFARGPIMGAGFGLVLVVSPMLAGLHGMPALYSLGGLIIVVGGVIATAFMSFDAADVRTALRAIPDMLREPPAIRPDLTQDMNAILHWARQTQGGGLGALRASLDDARARPPFVRYGLNMVLGEYRPEEVRAMLETAADAGYDRDCPPVDVLRAMTGHAPAFGMAGTLAGMITMLCDLNGDVAATGSVLAVAFLSTLYGVVSARMIYMPAAARLQKEVDDRQQRHALITEGMVMLARGESPSRIQDRLNGFLRPEQHDYFDIMSVTPAHTARAKERAPVRATLGLASL